MKPEIQIAGAGPAGTAAAIAALEEGAAVHLHERSREAHHKVCGEFISPEAFRVLQRLGVSRAFLRLRPPLIRRCILRLRAGVKGWNFDEPAFGLSRLALDRLLLDHAAASGARVTRGEIFQPRQDGTQTVVLASGRRSAAPRGGRLFGFKAHFDGAADDAVELHFTRFGYVGVSPVENGETNVCGLAPEEALRRHGFHVDEMLAAEPVIAARLRPLSRRMRWLMTGPLSFSRVADASAAAPQLYPAGDGLGFVDPFTGSGILNALLTGRLAGIAAAAGKAAPEYLRACARLLGGPFAISAAFRALVRVGAEQLAVFVPGSWLYRLTRARTLGAFDA
jgi:flavin-dependent dehydrogenase